jgi:hypothetical protein
MLDPEPESVLSTKRHTENSRNDTPPPTLSLHLLIHTLRRQLQHIRPSTGDVYLCSILCKSRRNHFAETCAAASDEDDLSIDGEEVGDRERGHRCGMLVNSVDIGFASIL